MVAFVGFWFQLAVVISTTIHKWKIVHLNIIRSAMATFPGSISFYIVSAAGTRDAENPLPQIEEKQNESNG